ncbi:MAG: hypothetical protein V1810_02110 [Candidatus Beckwithbacteria bacterium]
MPEPRSESPSIAHLPRRNFLQLLGITAGGMLLNACGGNKSTQIPTPESTPATPTPEQLTLEQCLADPQKLIMVPENNLGDIGVGLIQPDSTLSQTIETVGKGHKSAVWIRPASQDALVFRGQNDLAEKALIVFSELFAAGRLAEVPELAGSSPDDCQPKDLVIAGKDNVIGWNLTQIQEQVTGLDKFTTVNLGFDFRANTNVLQITQSVRSPEDQNQWLTSTLVTFVCPADLNNWQVVPPPSPR